MSNELTNTNTQLAPVVPGIDIQGLEDVPVSIIPIPWVRLVQPTSKDTANSDGKDADSGSYLYKDTKEEVKELRFALIKAKITVVDFGKDGEQDLKKRLNVLGYDLDRERLFILPLSVMSFSNFGSLIAQFKQAKVKNSWEYEVSTISTKEENDKGKYYVANFRLGKKLDSKLIIELEKQYQGYGIALDRNLAEEDKEAQETQQNAEQVFNSEPAEQVDESRPNGNEEVKDQDLPF